MQKLTENATHDDLTNEQYIEIADEIRGYNEETGEKGMSWDKFIIQVGSFKFRAQWSEWRKGERVLLREMKNDLRREVGLKELSESVQQVVERMVCPDALVEVETDVTEGQGEYVAIYKQRPTEEKPVTPVTEKRKQRVGVMRPSHVPTKYDEQRKKLGKSWIEVVQAGLISIERGDVDGKRGKGGRQNGH